MTKVIVYKSCGVMFYEAESDIWLVWGSFGRFLGCFGAEICLACEAILGQLIEYEVFLSCYCLQLLSLLQASHHGLHRAILRLFNMLQLRVITLVLHFFQLLILLSPRLRLVITLT